MYCEPREYLTPKERRVFKPVFFLVSLPSDEESEIRRRRVDGRADLSLRLFWHGHLAVLRGQALICFKIDRPTFSR